MDYFSSVPSVYMDKLIKVRNASDYMCADVRPMRGRSLKPSYPFALFTGGIGVNESITHLEEEEAR